MRRIHGGLPTRELRLFHLLFLVVFAATSSASFAQTFSTLVNFDGTDGDFPYQTSLIQGTDGNFYGTTEAGGTSSPCANYGCGTIFKVTLEGALTTLYNFCPEMGCDDGNEPTGGLVEDANGNFYGEAFLGGTTNVRTCPSGCGTIFELTSTGTFRILHSFCSNGVCTDGCFPAGGLVQGVDGQLYGTTFAGGTSASGAVFRITLDGELTILHSFSGPDGSGPFGRLALDTDGNFYGTTQSGGASSNCEYGCGTVFKITPGGKLTTLHSFDEADGAYPWSGVVRGQGGSFYGTTVNSEASPACSSGCGTVFKTTSGGAFSTVYRFDSTDGSYPYGGLIQATDGNFYGTTLGGGTSNYGTVFRLTSGATKLNTVHSFDNTDGAFPYDNLLQATNGSVYSTTYKGGANDSCYQGCGTVFTISNSLGPFVAFLRGYGKTGNLVEILGQSLTGTTSVSFNGVPAHFNVVSDTFIKATVPSGAASGYVAVVTPSGTLTSNLPLVVIP